MLTRRSCLVAFTAASILALTACHGFFTSRDDSTTPPTTISGKFAYVANTTTLVSTLSPFTISSSNGALTPILTTPAIMPAALNAVLTDPAGNYLFLCLGGTALQSYKIDRSTGNLVANAVGQVLDIDPWAAAVTPNGKFIFAVSKERREIYVVQVSSTGGLDLNGTITLGATVEPEAAAVDPTGRMLYVTAGTSGTLVYSIGSTNGALTAGDTVPANGEHSARSIAFTPDGKFAYISNGATAGGVDMYAVNGSNGALTLIGGSPASTGGDTPTSLAVDANGKYLYVANTNSAALSAFAIASDGKLTAISGSPYTVGVSPEAVVIDPSGAIVYVANAGSNSVTVFKIGSGGALSKVSSTSTPAPVSIAVTK